jgi:hypothetical protein
VCAYMSEIILFGEDVHQKMVHVCNAFVHQTLVFVSGVGDMSALQTWTKVWWTSSRC